ncbi:MAG: S8 family serine peptidase [Edaphobacter sp.]
MATLDRPGMGGVIDVAASTKREQYVLLPPRGLRSDNKELGDFFGSLSHMQDPLSRVTRLFYGVSSVQVSTARTDIQVLDSIHEDGAKLVEMSPEGLSILRAAQPDIRVAPIVYYDVAVAPRPHIRQSASTASTLPSLSLPITVVSADNGQVIPGATVIGFTNFASKTGADGVTDANGNVALGLSGNPTELERLYVYPRGGWWPLLEENVSLSPGDVIKLTRIDLAQQDLLREKYEATATPTDGMGIRIGVIDTGAGAHPDLLISGGANFVAGENPADYGDNGVGHGTHVAGIIGARGTVPLGMRGLAPEAEIYSYRVFAQGTSTGAMNYVIAKAVDRAVADGCHIINLSLTTADTEIVLSQALDDARAAGVIVICAAGNDYRAPVGFPASYAYSVGVSAFGRLGSFPNNATQKGNAAPPYGADPNHFIADFSNVGPDIDFTGPGVGIVSTFPGGYGVLDGTSMACPAISGVCARLMSQNPTFLGLPANSSRVKQVHQSLVVQAILMGFGATFEGQGFVKV